MNRSPAHRLDIEELVEAYRADLVAAGMFAGHPVTSVARTFFTRVGVAGWSALPLASQCALPLKDRRVVGWLIVTGRLRPSPDYLVACRPYLGEVAAHHHRRFHERFVADLHRARVRSRRDPPAVVRPGQGGRAGRADSRAADPAGDRCAAKSVDRRDNSSPTRQPRRQGTERGAVRCADHSVPPRRPRQRAPQNQPGPLGRAGRPVGGGPATAGGHPHRLHRPDTVVAAGLDDGARRGRAAGVRRLAGRERHPGGLRRRPASGTHRGLQAAPVHPALGPRRPVVQDQSRRTPWHPAHLLRPAHRMGRRRHSHPRARVLRRPAAAGRPAAQVPRRRRVHQAAAGRARRRRPVRPTVRGVPRPHRPAQGRIPRSHSRFRRADRGRVLVARAARETAHRPLHPLASPTQGSPRRLDRHPTHQPAQPLPVRRARPTHRRGPRRSGSRRKPRKRLASAVFRPIASGIPWRPRRSTAA